MKILTLLLAGFLASPPIKDARLDYTLRFEPSETTAISVRLLVRNAPASIQIAAHAHPGYDNKYWRYVDDFRATGPSGQPLMVSRVDSVRWQLNNGGGDVIVTYRVRFPEEQSPRASSRPFLSPTGGLIGGPDSFLYVVGLEKERADVTLDIPSGWRVGTGLEGKSTARNFAATDVHTLMESPMLVGNLSEWTFNVRNVPHRVFYWPLPNRTPFDSAAFVRGLEKIAAQSISLFGSAPYREYSFLFQDGALSGGLEHPNSVTLGAQSEELGKNPNFGLGETAHEFVHAWNLMAIKPAEYREIDYRAQPPVKELWFSEGITIYYADLLRRRAGIPLDDATRTSHLEALLERYFSMPGNARFSAEKISSVENNSRAEELGDYLVSAHLVGEILGAVLDLRIRDASNGARNMDDVMRLMYTRFRDRKFTNEDVEKAVSDVCACDASPIFARHIYSAGGIEFNNYLEPVGLRAEVASKPAIGSDGKPQRDLRMWAWEENGALRLRVSNPESVWGKAGLHTGDRLLTVNGKTITKWPEFRSMLAGGAIGDKITLVVMRGSTENSHTVVFSGYDRPDVAIRPIERPSEKQIRLLRAWQSGQ